MFPSQKRREFLRGGCRLFRSPEHEALLMGQRISELRQADLEAFYELVMEAKPPPRH